MTIKSRMRNYLRVATLAGCTIVACAVPMLAQDAPPAPAAGQQQGDRPSPAEMQQRRLDMMTKQLDLTPDQVAQVKAILESQQQQMQAMRDSVAAGGDPRSQMSSIRRATSAKIRGLLTEDQKPKFDQMESRMSQRQGAGAPAGGPPPPPPAAI